MIRRRSRRRELRAAAIGVLLVVAFTVAVFTKDNPFADHHEVQAVFSTAATLSEGSEVRIGGQRVGEVTAIGPGPSPATSQVTMRIDDREPAIRTDAELAVQPRLALEGNSYVRVSPGSPDRPELEEGATIPRAQTSVAVQLDQAISTFDQPARSALADTIRELGDGLGTTPPSPRAPRPGYAELQDAARELERALPPMAVAARAARGERPGDLRRAVRTTGEVTGQLAQDPAALDGLVRHYATVSRTLASRDAALRRTLAGFAATLADAPGDLRDIDAALPALTRFAGELRPALRAAPPALSALGGAAREVTRATRPGELPALLERTGPLVRAVPVLERRLGAVLPQVEAIGRCLTSTVVPALDGKIQDGHLTTGGTVWQEALWMASSLAGAASAFDANGGTLRLGVTESEQAIGINTGSGPLGRLSGLSPDGDVGMNPTWLGYGVYPAMRPDVPCQDQQLPDYGARRRPGAPAAFRDAGKATPRRMTQDRLEALLRQLRSPKTLLKQAVEATR
ncbi:MlaD family protein [Conexibacter sp. SYSU D00693]|uniref:MlaD family protein n=1 Tax=Conexibacter sp. SYSU D00693 TaxID=2812560 RepID=UPI00196A820F|nr:MlaD family protein [Conexibacter sp. SYSU D00693]